MTLLVLWLVFLYINSSNQLHNGDKCTFQKTGATGKCTSINECNSAKEALRRKERPQHCEFDRFTPIVCCTDAQNDNLLGRQKIGHISLKKCMEYSKIIYPTKDSKTCPIMFEEDAGYRPALPKEFAHTVLIGYDVIIGKQWVCTAVLISESYVLTTTDCLYNGKKGKARIGGNLNPTTKYDENVQIRNITELIPFPHYLSRRTDNNIALAKLSSPVVFNEFVHPACLHRDPNFGNKFFSFHWQFDFFESQNGNDIPGSEDPMKKVSLERIAPVNCSRYESISDTAEEYICAALLSISKNQCSPKGPLLTTHPKAFCMHTVVGLIAFSEALCDGVIYPTAYTNVYDYIDWIEKTVWKDEMKS